jgi:protein-L-isoaspartate(D-aspartate) O-methyltransferase
LVQAARQHLAAAGAHNVEVVQADGGFGHAPGAPYDRIILTVGAWDVAPAWHAQLAPGGRLVLPLELGQGPQKSLALDKPVDPHADMWFESTSARDCGFMRLRGAMAGPEQTTPIDPQASLHLAYPGAPPATPEAVFAWLLEASSETETGLVITERELWGGLTFWLGLQAPNLCSLTEQLVPGQRRRLPDLIEFAGRSPTCFTLGLLSAAGLSVLCRSDHRRLSETDRDERESFKLSLRAFGPDGQTLTQDLFQHLDDWQSAGRPNADGLRVRVYPRQHPYSPVTGEIVVAKRDTLLVLDWPAG